MLTPLGVRASPVASLALVSDTAEEERAAEREAGGGVGGVAAHVAAGRRVGVGVVAPQMGAGATMRGGVRAGRGDGGAAFVRDR